MEERIFYVIYIPSTGEIRHYGFVMNEEDYDNQILYDDGIEAEVISQIEITDVRTQYVPSGVLTTRPLLSTANSWNKTTILANGVDSCVFGPSLPNCTVRVLPINNTAFDIVTLNITDGEFEFTSDAPGEFIIQIDSFPYQFYEQLITVQAA